MALDGTDARRYLLHRLEQTRPKLPRRFGRNQHQRYTDESRRTG